MLSLAASAKLLLEKTTIFIVIISGYRVIRQYKHFQAENFDMRCLANFKIPPQVG